MSYFTGLMLRPTLLEGYYRIDRKITNRDWCHVAQHNCTVANSSKCLAVNIRLLYMLVALNIPTLLVFIRDVT